MAEVPGEGVDIFSKVPPWAIMFGVADRWQVCAERQRRIPASPGGMTTTRNDGFLFVLSLGRLRFRRW